MADMLNGPTRAACALVLRGSDRPSCDPVDILWKIFTGRLVLEGRIDDCAFWSVQATPEGLLLCGRAAHRAAIPGTVSAGFVTTRAVAHGYRYFLLAFRFSDL